MALQPETKRTALLVIGAVAVASMFTGYFDELVVLTKSAFKMFGLG